jgi:hypothetical protein
MIAMVITAGYLVQTVSCHSAVPPREPVEPRSAIELCVDELLRATLDASEYEVLTTRGYLDVASPTYPGTVYRIPRRGGMVTMYVQGRAVVDLCVVSTQPLPSGDIVIMHKLMIQGSEEEYLAQAHQHLAHWFGHRYRP